MWWERQSNQQRLHDIVSDTDNDYRNDPAPLTWLGRQPQGEEGQLTGGLINEAETENAHLLLN